MLTCYKKLPTFSNILRRSMRQPNSIIIQENCSLFEKVEEYIVKKHAKRLQVSNLTAKNNDLTCSLRNARFHSSIIETFEGEKIQIRLQRANGKSELTTESWLRFLYPGVSVKDIVGENQHQVLIVLSSWTLSVTQLKKYVKTIYSLKSVELLEVYVPSLNKFELQKKSKQTHHWDEDEGKFNQVQVQPNSPKWMRICVKSSTTLSNTIVSDEIQSQLLDDVSTFMENEAWYNAKGIPYKRGWLLNGVPGTGKTTIIKAIANSYHLPIFRVDFGLITTDAEFRYIMSSITHYTQNKPYLLAFEDFDRCDLFKNAYDRKSSLTESCLLNEIDGLTESHGRLLFITVNDMSNLLRKQHAAFLRPGRVDRVVEFKPCKPTQIKRMLKHFYSSQENKNIIFDGDRSSNGSNSSGSGETTMTVDEYIDNIADEKLTKNFTPASLVSLLHSHLEQSELKNVVDILTKCGDEGELQSQIATSWEQQSSSSSSRRVTRKRRGVGVKNLSVPFAARYVQTIDSLHKLQKDHKKLSTKIHSETKRWGKPRKTSEKKLQYSEQKLRLMKKRLKTSSDLMIKRTLAKRKQETDTIDQLLKKKRRLY